MQSNCCNPKAIGFSDNIPMFKMQIDDMPVYKNTGTTGRFKANRGAGSVCTMVKSLVAGVQAGISMGLLQKPSYKEVKAKKASADAATKSSHAAEVSKSNKLHKGLVGKVVSGASTKHAAAHAGANGRVAKSAAKVEKFWAKKEAGFRAKARALNKKQRAAAKSMESGVKAARKALNRDTASSLVAMHKAMVAEKKMMAKSAKFQKEMHAVQVKMSHEDAAAKKASAARLAKYKKEMAANAKAIAAGKAQQKKIAADMKAANLKLAADQKKLNAKYKATMAKLSATNAKNQKAFNAAQKESQKKFAAKFAGNKAAYAAAKAAIAKSVAEANKEAAAKTARINKRHAAEQAAKKKADTAYAKKAAADAAALKKARAATAEKFAKTAEKSAKADEASDKEIKECAIDGSECQTPDGKCHKVTPKGPFMGDDLVSCADKKPVEQEDAGLSWAGIEPPLPPEKCPPASAKCKSATAACKADKYCSAAIKKGCFKGSLNKWFAMQSNCCNPKAIGFSDNIPMFKMQIDDMPVYKNTGTTGRFKANRGAGSVCTMVKSLVAGVQAGISMGLLQKPSYKEVKAKKASADAATKSSHAAEVSKSNKLHKGLVGKVVSGASTKHAAAHAGANGRVAKSAAKVEKYWAKKEAGFRAKARALNKKQRAAAKSMESGVKAARKALAKDTAS